MRDKIEEYLIDVIETMLEEIDAFYKHYYSLNIFDKLALRKEKKRIDNLDDSICQLYTIIVNMDKGKGKKILNENL